MPQENVIVAGKQRPKRARIARKPRKPRKTKIGVWREYFVPDGAYHRYEGLRGVYWYWLSRDVRESEWKKYGVCLTCLEDVQDWEKDGQCGHVIPSDRCGEALRFARENLCLQHSWCNNPKITPQAGILNSLHYDHRYGTGATERLLKRVVYHTKEPTQQEYRELISALHSYQVALQQKAQVQ